MRVCLFVFIHTISVCFILTPINNLDHRVVQNNYNGSALLPIYDLPTWTCSVMHTGIDRYVCI